LRTYRLLPQEYPGIVKTSNITSETYRNVPITIGVWHGWSAEKLLSAVKALIKQAVFHFKSVLGMYFIFILEAVDHFYVPSHYCAIMEHFNLQWSAHLPRTQEPSAFGSKMLNQESVIKSRNQGYKEIEEKVRPFFQEQSQYDVVCWQFTIADSKKRRTIDQDAVSVQGSTEKQSRKGEIVISGRRSR